MPERRPAHAHKVAHKETCMHIREPMLYVCVSSCYCMSCILLYMLYLRVCPHATACVRHIAIYIFVCGRGYVRAPTFLYIHRYIYGGHIPHTYIHTCIYPHTISSSSSSSSSSSAVEALTSRRTCSKVSSMNTHTHTCTCTHTHTNTHTFTHACVF